MATPTDVELPPASVLKRAGVSAEVAWWLLSRGREIPADRPRRKSADPGEAAEARFDPGAVDRAVVAIASAGVEVTDWEIAHVVGPAFGWVGADRRRLVGWVYLADGANHARASSLVSAIGRAAVRVGGPSLVAVVPEPGVDWRLSDPDGALAVSVAADTGDLLPKAAHQHGTLRAYRAGCSCDLCSEANNESKRAERERRRARERETPAAGRVERAVRAALRGKAESKIAEARREIAYAAARHMDHGDPRYFRSSADVLRAVLADIEGPRRAPGYDDGEDGEAGNGEGKSELRDYLAAFRDPGRGRDRSAVDHT